MRLILNIPRRKPDYAGLMLRRAVLTGSPVSIVAACEADAQRIFDATSAWLNGTPKETVPG